MGLVVGFQNSLSLSFSIYLQKAWPKPLGSPAQYLWKVLSCRGLQRFAEAIRGKKEARVFETLHKKKLAGGVVMSRYVAERLGQHCWNFLQRVVMLWAVFPCNFRKSVAIGVLQTHHVKLARCGCSHTDVEDMKPGVCWSCLL